MRKIFGFIFIVLFGFLSAQIAERPNPQRLYNNLSSEYPQFLNSSEAQQLENKLVQFSKETSNQICVVIIDDLNGFDPASYATKIINEWGVGKKGANNGIVILLKPNSHDLFIAPGYGLEGAIPDLAIKRIRENEMNPYLKNGENYTALDKGTTVLMQLAKGEINEKDYSGNSGGRKVNPGLIIIIIVIAIIIFRKGGGSGRTFSSGGSTYWGGGGGFGGGGSGGGFGGFGGGSSGGGGSGGKW
ncbi:MAG: TPM domain-containing protein [Bacteroidetes bacterium]|nr:TPM domain-containing protein [Bacteroidota bacterium]